MSKRRFFTPLLCLFLISALAGPVVPQALAQEGPEVKVACASNFMAPMKELVDLFKENMGMTAVPSFGSTGLLYGQIVQGAPFDVFLAADSKRPEMLEKEGLAGDPAVYAKGRTVFWTELPEAAEAGTWQEALDLSGMKKIGLADPRTAPYGAAAVEAMEKAGVYASVEPRLAFGKNVGQAFHFAQSGAAQGAFAALSQIKALELQGRLTGKYWVLDQAPLIEQSACVILREGASFLAQPFLGFLLHDPDARAAVAKYGYQ